MLQELIVPSVSDDLQSCEIASRDSANQWFPVPFFGIFAGEYPGNVKKHDRFCIVLEWPLRMLQELVFPVAFWRLTKLHNPVRSLKCVIVCDCFGVHFRKWIQTHQIPTGWYCGLITIQDGPFLTTTIFTRFLTLQLIPDDAQDSKIAWSNTDNVSFLIIRGSIQRKRFKSSKSHTVYKACPVNSLDVPSVESQIVYDHLPRCKI